MLHGATPPPLPQVDASGRDGAWRPQSAVECPPPEASFLLQPFLLMRTAAQVCGSENGQPRDVAAAVPERLAENVPVRSVSSWV